MGTDGGDGGDRMAVVEDLVLRQQIERIEVSIERRLAAVLKLHFAGQRREVPMGDNGPHAGHPQSPLRVYRFDPRMRMGAAQDFAVQHRGRAVISAVFGASDHLVDAVVADRPGADYFVLFAVRYGSGHWNSPRQTVCYWSFTDRIIGRRAAAPSGVVARRVLRPGVMSDALFQYRQAYYVGVRDADRRPQTAFAGLPRNDLVPASGRKSCVYRDSAEKSGGGWIRMLNSVPTRGFSGVRDSARIFSRANSEQSRAGCDVRRAYPAHLIVQTPKRWSPKDNGNGRRIPR